MKALGPLGECRDCGNVIRWIRNDTTGRAHPVDPTPHPEGNIAAQLRGGRLVGFVISRDRRAGPLHPYRFIPHQATCPERPKPKPKPPPDPALF